MILTGMMWAAAGSGDGFGEILAALFPPVAMATVFLLIGWTALRNTDWKKSQDRDMTGGESKKPELPTEPGASP